MDSKKFRILVGIPTMGSIDSTLVSHLIKWAKDFEKTQIGFYFTYKVAPVDRARNEIVQFFMRNRRLKDGSPIEPFTHLFFVDSDTVPPADAVKKLFSHDKEIVSGVTPILHYDKQKAVWGTLDNCFIKQDRDAEGKIIRTYAVERDSGLQEIIKCGGSCLLIKREVFEKLEKPYFKFLYNDEGTEHTQSEDLYFCNKAREAGFTIWCDTSVICNHHKSVVL